jgi:hypothetical protein
MVDDRKDLLFHCLNSEIDRQFEFAQHPWLLNLMFGGAYNQSDPLIGPKCPLSIPSLPDFGNFARDTRCTDVKEVISLSEVFTNPYNAKLDVITGAAPRSSNRWPCHSAQESSLTP